MLPLGRQVPARVKHATCHDSLSGMAGANDPHSEPAVGMLDSGRVESTGLVGFAQKPMVLNDSLRLRVPTDRLRRNCLSAYELGR